VSQIPPPRPVCYKCLVKLHNYNLFTQARLYITTFYFSEKDENNTFSHIHLFMVLCGHSIPSLQLPDTKLGLKMCVNYARKLNFQGCAPFT